MAVVEFSLTNDARDKLQQALRPYIYGKRKKPADFVKIIEENLPSQILDELRHYVNTKGLSTVYIIRNLGEIQPEAADKSDRWAKAKLYMGQVARALADALKLEKLSHYNHHVIHRYSGEKSIFGDVLHKHEEDITMLSGVLSDGANTRFADRRILHKNTEKEAELPPLSDYSQDVLIDHGALAIWANDGAILHQALPSTQDTISRQEDELLRIVVRTSRNRPSPAL